MNIPKKQFYIPLPFSPPQPGSAPLRPLTLLTPHIPLNPDQPDLGSSSRTVLSQKPETASLKQTTTQAQYIVFVLLFELLWVDNKDLDWTFFCLSLFATRLLSHPLTHTRPVRDARCGVLISPTIMNISSSVSPFLLIATELVVFSNRVGLQCESQMYSFPVPT